MNKIISSVYSGKKVKLDNNSFVRCTFTDCILEFSGTGVVELNECTFDNVQWLFSGAAQNTLGFLHGMYNGMGEGGKKIVEATFDNIRGKSLNT